ASGVFCCQAEDGIRARTVTGVQTCALPILWASGNRLSPPADFLDDDAVVALGVAGAHARLQHIAMHLEHRQLLAEPFALIEHHEIGRASCRGRVWLCGGGGRGTTRKWCEMG